MSDVVSRLQTAIPMALVGGVVYAGVSYAVDGRVDFVGGAVFMLVFGVVVTVGLVYADRSEE
jgi:membrane protein YdbS with pleckstrin-like domain